MQTLDQKEFHEVLRQGYAISNEMKNDIIDLYFKSIVQNEYKNPTDYIRLRLEMKYGLRMGCNIMSQEGAGR